VRPVVDGNPALGREIGDGHNVDRQLAERRGKAGDRWRGDTRNRTYWAGPMMTARCQRPLRPATRAKACAAVAPE
jgi:hypothetical protein